MVTLSNVYVLFYNIIGGIIYEQSYEEMEQPEPGKENICRHGL